MTGVVSHTDVVRLLWENKHVLGTIADDTIATLEMDAVRGPAGREEWGEGLAGRVGSGGVASAHSGAAAHEGGGWQGRMCWIRLGCEHQAMLCLGCIRARWVFPL